MNTDNQQPRLKPAKETRLSRSGFTLVELLVVISIIGILMAIVVGAIRGANQDTLVSKTRGTIAKIDSILNDRYESYISTELNFNSGPTLVSRFPVEKLNVPPAIRVTRSDASVSLGLLRDRVRLAATRDLMRMEMPDCVGDLYASPNVPRPGTLLATGLQNGSNVRLLMQIQTSGLFTSIIQRVEQGRDLSGAVVPNAWLTSNANEELLYLVVESTVLNGSSSIELFGNSEIADTDNDGLNEFIDAWGQPIRWLRWPAGVSTTSQLNPDPLSFTSIATDPLDPAASEVSADVTLQPPASLEFINSVVGLRPLVVSAGIDGKHGIRFQWSDNDVNGGNRNFFSASSVQWPLTSNSLSNAPWPVAPTYFNIGFNWPDPHHPRYVQASTGVNDSRYRLGARIIPAYDPALEIDAKGESVQSDPAYADDNVTNLDESGASL